MRRQGKLDWFRQLSLSLAAKPNDLPRYGTVDVVAELEETQQVSLCCRVGNFGVCERADEAFVAFRIVLEKDLREVS